jgi:Xaa-Pro aminopeptidase
MRQFAFLCAVIASVAAAYASDPIARDEYRSRRAELRKGLEGPLVLFGRAEGSDDVFRGFQEPNFYYLTGWEEPGAILLLTKSEEILFLPHRNSRRELYMGRRTAAEDANAAAETGFDSVLPVERFESQFARALDTGPEVYALSDHPETERVKALAPLREIRAASALVAKLRIKKSPAEIAAIQHATDVSIQAQREAWKHVRAGGAEYEAAGAFLGAVIAAGCEGPAYSPIFGSGPNATTLHYSANSRRMDAGELIVIDAAARCGGYTSDITRTLPVDGKFTRRQREIYDIVLGAQKAAIAAIKPGATFSSLTSAAREYINTHGKDAKGNPLGKYLPHGVSHSVGLDVHDPAGGVNTLSAGMVITVEPGIYIPEEKIGVRIEDTVLVTENGAKILSGALPKEPDEVEKALAK